MSIKKLVNAVNATAHTAETLGERFAKELSAILRGVERRLGPVVQDASVGNPTAIVKAARANRTRRELRAILVDAGYDTLSQNVYGERLDAIVGHVLDTRRLAQQSAALSASAEQKLAALRALAETDLLDEGEELARALWQATVRGVFGSQPVEKILADLYALVDDTAPHLQTLYDTSVSIFGRQVEALQAGDDPDTVFAYMGPADTKNREFCRARVGKVFTRAEIDAMDNGQLDNVYLTAGGYACRHMWTEISRFSELQDLVGTGDRIPEVAAQLDALREAA